MTIKPTMDRDSIPLCTLVTCHLSLVTFYNEAIEMSKMPTRLQTSAGGVAFRHWRGQLRVALISVGEGRRWQLPKGIVSRDETTEAAAQREVHEEAGIDTELIELIDKIEYWYVSRERGQMVRFHKFVYFYLLRYVTGDVRNHDDEVHEARWFEIDAAIEALAFANEKQIVRRAKERLAALL
jgi:8-oxo-dGTP pyrophosphatase MutT (NUDIX family)